MQLTERIKIIRNKNKLSQAIFAEQLHVDRSYISKIETGKAKPPELLSVRICLDFNISYRWLLEGKGPMVMEYGSEDLRNLEKSGLISRSMKSLFVLYEFALKQLDHFINIAQCLGNDIFKLEDPSIKPGNPIIIEVVRDILNKLESSPHYRSFKKYSTRDEGDLREVERSVLNLLRAFDDQSLKDFYLFLASKGSMLEKNKRDKLRKYIAVLKKAVK